MLSITCRVNLWALKICLKFLMPDLCVWNCNFLSNSMKKLSLFLAKIYDKFYCRILASLCVCVCICMCVWVKCSTKCDIWWFLCMPHMPQRRLQSALGPDNQGERKTLYVWEWKSAHVSECVCVRGTISSHRSSRNHSCCCYCC